jgi:hypothetical protein
MSAALLMLLLLLLRMLPLKMPKLAALEAVLLREVRTEIIYDINIQLVDRHQ